MIDVASDYGEALRWTSDSATMPKLRTCESTPDRKSERTPDRTSGTTTPDRTGLIAQLIVLLSALTPLPALFGTATQIMLWVFVPFYAFRAMRRVYGQGRFVTVIKYMALFFAYAASLVITFTAGLLFSALSLE